MGCGCKRNNTTVNKGFTSKSIPNQIPKINQAPKGMPKSAPKVAPKNTLKLVPKQVNSVIQRRQITNSRITTTKRFY